MERRECVLCLVFLEEEVENFLEDLVEIIPGCKSVGPKEGKRGMMGKEMGFRIGPTGIVLGFGTGPFIVVVGVMLSVGMETKPGEGLKVSITFKVDEGFV